MIGITREAIADHFSVDFRAARLGMLIFFQHDNASTLAHYKAVAILVIGAAGCFGAVIIGHVERARLGKTGDPQRVDSRFRAASEHDIGIIIADHSRCIANRMGTGRAGSYNRMVGALQTIFDLHLTCDQVDQAAMHEMGGNAARTAFV